MSENPYKNLPDHCYWRRAVTWAAPGELDPMVAENGLTISRKSRVSTLGSCFAQHVSRHLRLAGFNHYDAEPCPPGIKAEEAQRRGYGVFSARYGNVYTIRQAVQLFDRAFGAFEPLERAWRRDAVVVDPFRPTLEPDGFATEEAMLEARAAHLACVRDVFVHSEVLVFTLGLTEGWRSRLDGAVFPVAPGVSGGGFDPERHEFVEFDMAASLADLLAFCARVHAVNRGCHIILTVSPVSLIATRSNRHVLTATTHAKSVLRVAAEEAARKFPERVSYFPSYEIITAPQPAGNYYDSDLRQVTEAGVAHVMRVFSKHFLGRNADHAPLDPGLSVPCGDVVCDEDIIARAIEVYRT